RSQRLQDRAGEASHRPRSYAGRVPDGVSLLPDSPARADGGRRAVTDGGDAMTTAHIGRPTSRVDGRAKVTGAAKYAAEYNVPNLTYGVVVSSPIARGRTPRIDAAAALTLPGVLRVLTHENPPKLAAPDSSWRDDIAPPGSPLRPLHDGEIKHSAQPV